MPRYLLIVDYRPGDDATPMDEWKPAEITAHMDYYGALNKALAESGELVGMEALTPPVHGKQVIGDGASAPIVSDGPFAEAKEILAGFQIVEVESEARAIEIAALVSAVPGPGGVPLRQPITIRRVMDSADFEAMGA
ncbi:YciI family protein [Paractinoplanes durhamensis]|uniref:Sigma associated protein n=1 Tax=Paractinoplanes durhamensis TaxID=113563 RepID=A0ABQ3Z4R0_9ACTN|nr:YciI family protein [Actinoplanes durhamensis]GIE04796.1 sigma associated protein [Actinoplanes durhamensis]